MKTKDIKDYLHLYLGCPCRLGDSNITRYIEMVNSTGLSVCTGTETKSDGTQIPVWWKSKDCKLLLRPLSNMTEEEFKKAGLLTHPKYWKEHISNYSFQIHTIIYLLSRGFDLFDLIPENLAIDKTTLK